MSGMILVNRRSVFSLSLSAGSDQQLMIDDFVQSIFMARNSLNLSWTKLDKIRRESSQLLSNFRILFSSLQSLTSFFSKIISLKELAVIKQSLEEIS